MLERAAAEDDRVVERIAELVDGGTCHDWLWKIGNRDGSRLSEEDFLLAFRSRFGAEIVTGDSRCRICGEPLDASAAHAFCCAPGASTRGHYAVVGCVADGLAIADPGL